VGAWMENPGAAPSSDKKIIFPALGQKPPPCFVRRRDTAARPARFSKVGTPLYTHPSGGGHSRPPPYAPTRPLDPKVGRTLYSPVMR